MSTSAIDTIETLTRRYAADRATLSDRLGELDADLMAVKRRRLRGIRSALAKATDSKTALEAAIAGNPHLFIKPRTITVDGIRVGIQKGKGKIEWDDDAKVVALIEKYFPDAAEQLVKTARTPIKAAVANLTAADLRRIGVRIVESGDEVIIKPQDSELDKLINRILEDTKDIHEI